MQDQDALLAAAQEIERAIGGLVTMVRKMQAEDPDLLTALRERYAFPERLADVGAAFAAIMNALTPPGRAEG